MYLIVPTLRVGMPFRTLRVQGDAERHRLHSHAERGNDHCAPGTNRNVDIVFPATSPSLKRSGMYWPLTYACA